MQNVENSTVTSEDQTNNDYEIPKFEVDSIELATPELFSDNSSLDSSDLNTENIKVKECYADGGPHMKRFRAASMGRISKLNKPTAHLTVVVADNNN